ncbi:sensor histidine kinase [Pseudoxanthomonas sp. PXM03]|uniref:sensor histidine kinase n=1 Tax=Pseudoxanthomonas sp. PXM03 TaxID=2769284 RepID=UPI001CE19750|nr:sensor histidine kinase [Pseudoxanthomonas sp. PXM03]
MAALSLDVPSCLIRCDIDEVGILLRNLLHNALRYTSEGGHVLVRCGYEPATTPDAARAVFLEVLDDGPGVPEAEREVIFERFHRAVDTTVRGSGIGLSLVADIAQSHQASVRTGLGLDGQGLVVRVVFPPHVSSAHSPAFCRQAETPAGA